MLDNLSLTAMLLIHLAVDIRSALLGAEHRKIANAAKSLGVASYGANRLDDASFSFHQYVKITEAQPEQRKADEHLMVLIMLSDIQEVSNRHKLAQKILATARDLCNRDGIEKRFPRLYQMVHDRLSGSVPSSKKIVEGVASREHRKAELEVFQGIILTDD